MVNGYSPPDRRPIPRDERTAPHDRFRRHARSPTEAESALLETVKIKAEELETLFDSIRPGRYRSLGYTALEEAVMWAVKELTG